MPSSRPDTRHHAGPILTKPIPASRNGVSKRDLAATFSSLRNRMRLGNGHMEMLCTVKVYPHVRPPVRSRTGASMSEYRLAEQPALDALTALVWQLLRPAQASVMREEENRVILKPVLIEALRDINGIAAADAEAIYNDLATLSDNEDWQRKLRGGYSRRLTGENRDRPITLIDFKTPGNNSFHVVRQLRVAAQRPRIPDIVLFVNSIPLVVIEAKSPLKGTATGDRGVRADQAV